MIHESSDERVGERREFYKIDYYYKIIKSNYDSLIKIGKRGTNSLYMYYYLRIKIRRDEIAHKIRYIGLYV